MDETKEARTPNLLDTSPEEGARRLALSFLDEAKAAADRVVAGDDDEALHDLRVALRKLRTVLRTHREALSGSVPRKRRDRLKELVASTGTGRDAEVQLSWIDDVKGALEHDARAGAERLRERLIDRKDIAYVRLRSATVPALLELLPKLRRDLERYIIEHVVDQQDDASRYADLVAAGIKQQTDELAAALRSVHSIEDESIAHEGRIHGKRLRYLVEPLRDEVEGTRDVKTLKSLQDLLGELNDVAVRSRSLREQIEEVALLRARRLAAQAEGALGDRAPSIGVLDEQPGLLALVRLSHQRRQELFATLMAEWLGDGGRLLELVQAGHGLAARISNGQPSSAGELPTEIERKYLIRVLPDHAVQHGRVIEIDQGYVPGAKLHERIRRMRDGDKLTFYRAIKFGRGIRRIEIEEETDTEVFERLWSLTRGRRVRKRRYVVEHQGAKWEIDEFLDRELYLAEIELESEHATVDIPDWLKPHIEREVTGEDAFVNLNLAR